MYGIAILPIAFVIWFTISMVKLQRERNEILKEIVNEIKK
ncbi:preprotein translocase subunit YajC [Lysinibacillus sp. RC79]